ncbi:carbonic anhydrase [Nitrospirillum sp. BR 11752]|uniref:carbonic anhydrase n=1 Tax=Nitrospirillum sp. BR 11752 TaxID=3104293 RepID=UPI002EC26815|nr:carbonic anhydrase [Nitrospirillum sp. BR 11752]
MSVSRRVLIVGSAYGIGLTLGGGFIPASAYAAEGTKTDLTPEEALELLKKGNSEFKVDTPYNAAIGRERRNAIAQKQAPFAAVVTCSDSRVPPELLFGRGLGELFVIRNAGNTVDATALGSIEYAVGVLGVPLIVILGHERCGAVEAAVNVVTKNSYYPGSIGRMIEPIVPAVLSAQAKKPADLLRESVQANVARTVMRLRTASEPMLLEPLSKRKLRIVGATYDLDEGTVDFFDEG